jgi:hypothetical protein
MFDCKTGERVTGGARRAVGMGVQKRQKADPSLGLPAAGKLGTAGWRKAAALQGVRLGRRPLQKRSARAKRYLAVMAEVPTTIYSYFLPLALNFILSLSNVN